MVKTVAVIGGGICGLIATKTCLEENLHPVCFEKGDDIGGLWNYSEEVEDGRASVYESTLINTSKEYVAFSDFPPPKEMANYAHHTELMAYFRAYVDHFDLMKYVELRHQVISVERPKDHAKTGCWNIHVKDLQNETRKEIVVDFVMVAAGHHCFPRLPEFNGLRSFKGTVIHTHEFKTPQPFRNQNVLVIGAGNSAFDSVVDCSRVSKRAYLSTRRGCWVVSRVADEGYPRDLTNKRRIFSLLPKMYNEYRLKKAANKRFNHSLYGLMPNCPFSRSHVSSCDDLPAALIAGKVKIKPDIQQFTENGVIFVDGSNATLDAVILATGYIVKFPFLSEDIIEEKSGRYPMYKHMFLPNHTQHTMAFIGYVQAGAIPPIAEMQARYALKIFKKERALPSQKEMQESIRRARANIDKVYYKSERHNLTINFLRYNDDIAAQIGVFPKIFSRFFTDPKLAIALLFGPTVPYHYRLDGPNKWPKARETILEIWDRVAYPLNSHLTQQKPKTKISKFVIPISLGIFVTAWFAHKNL